MASEHPGLYTDAALFRLAAIYLSFPLASLKRSASVCTTNGGSSLACPSAPNPTKVKLQRTTVFALARPSRGGAALTTHCDGI